MGRPSIFDPVLGERICELIAEGKSLRTIAALKDMPGMTTVIRWLADEKSPELADFRAQYTRARELAVEVMAEEILELADADGVSPGAVARDRLGVETRKWLMGKLKPKKYGDKVEQVHSGGIQHAHAMGTLPAAEGYRQMLEGPKK